VDIPPDFLPGGAPPTHDGLSIMGTHRPPRRAPFVRWNA